MSEECRHITYERFRHNDKDFCPFCIVDEKVRLTAENGELRKAIDGAIHNLGVPQPGYPAPVAEAYRILAGALEEKK